MIKDNNYVWIFGENLGETANNNSFYFWRQVVNKENDNIEKYLVLAKTKKNILKYKELTNLEKRYVIWKNSKNHVKVYKKSDLAFVTLSYKDILPDKIKKNKVPIIYLQHGTLAIKKIGYMGDSYDNRLFRFIYYNSQIKETLKEENKFKDYQLFYGEYQPRYIELLKRNKMNEKNKESEKKITWFLTWREYLGENAETEIFIRKIKSIIKNEKIIKYLEENNIKLEIILHQFFIEKKDKLMEGVKSNKIHLISQNDTDVMQNLAESELLITDFSSVGFDFTFLNKPVLMFLPDLDEYLEKREIYCEIDELKKYAITKSEQLIEKIISNNYKINEFYRKVLPKEIDYSYIETGKHIDRMYIEFKKIQENKITFIGYNFYGVGGTVSATRSLAEGLLEKNYMVELLSLKKTTKAKEMPYCLLTKYIYNSKSKGKKEILKRSIFKWDKRKLKYLKNDPSKDLLVPYAGYKLEKILGKIKSSTVVSTRESLHQFLIDAKSENIKNKLYFYHCSASTVDELFPGVIEQLKQRPIDKAIFVTEKNKKDLEKKYQYNQYKDYLISGNSLESKNCIDFNEIKSIEKKEVYKVIYLLRISKERKNDINNLIEFGEYLKENKINNIIVDVYGEGNYGDKFLDLLEKNDLFDLIKYKGKTNEPTECIREHDALVDFSINHSFGMTYIEGILNGKKVYCMKNPGSLEVLDGIENSFIESHKDLVEKINNLPNISKEELENNYKKIEKRFSREIVAQKFIEFIKK